MIGMPWPEWDRDILVSVNRLGSPQWDGAWSLATSIVAWTPLYLGLLYGVARSFSGKRRLAVVAVVLFTLAFTLLTTEIVKETVQRLRPVNDPVMLKQLRVVVLAPGYSFFFRTCFQCRRNYHTLYTFYA